MNRTEYRANDTDKGAIIDHEGYTTFGRWEGSRFVVAYAKTGRTYASRKSAERQIARWMAA